MSPYLSRSVDTSHLCQHLPGHGGVEVAKEMLVLGEPQGVVRIDHLRLLSLVDRILDINSD